MFKPQSLQAIDRLIKMFGSKQLCAHCKEPGPKSWDKADKMVRSFYHEHCFSGLG